ncbi:MAG: zinc-binding dehydrogenase [Pseudomonadales bacterium]|jgi:NADPH2:quinone reductase|nr:zinc-binding dehydrogenase [Pseudomonadales bacterium]
MTDQLQLQSLVTKEGTLELSLAKVPVPVPGEDEVLVRVEAAPINPSDLGLLFGMADMTTASASGSGDSPVITATIPEGLRKIVAARAGQPMPVGNEGGGVVVDAGSSPEAQALLGKTVGILGGAMYTQFRCVKAKQCLAMHEGVTPAESASCFVNPLTALGMVETMKMEGFSALCHTAAASNLGQMLQKICLKDGIELVNVVRKQEQVDILKGIGAKHVCNSSEDSFMDDLTDAIAATDAYIAFDATGGGKLAGQLLTAMEAAAMRAGGDYNRYGSDRFKQVYIYGGLDRSPTTLNRNFGFSWSLGGWLLTPFLQKIGREAADKLRQRVADEIKTTFASSYTKEVSLAEALTLDAISVYGKQATGEKYLINPNK